jgi:hypothetical protein
MLHEIGKELQTQLRDRGWGSALVVDRENVSQVGSGRERIVIEHDLDGNDAFGPPKKTSPNPKQICTRSIAAKLTIYAQASAKDKAQEYEHRRRAESQLDLVIAAMHQVAVTRRNDWSPTGGRFIRPEDVAEADRWGGAAYELSFTFGRAVNDVAATEFEIYFARMTGSPTLTFAEVGATGDTLTRSSGSWIEDGFEVGQYITVEGSALNNVTGPIASLTATVITFGSTDLANEGPVSGCAVTARTITSTTVVSQHGGEDDDNDPTTPPITAETACG